MVALNISVGMSKMELRHITSVVVTAANMKKPVCLIFTSEIAVDLNNESLGKGGKCQEVALVTAIELKKKHDQHSCLQVQNDDTHHQI